MIGLGLDTAQKNAAVERYVSEHEVSNVVVFYPMRHRIAFHLDVPTEYVEYEDIIKYVFFYRLLQEIKPTTLLVFNEVMRTTDRSCLHYNCLRNYLSRTEHSLVLQAFPALESPDDFMILVDLDTRSRWRRSQLCDVSEKLRVDERVVLPVIDQICVPTDARLLGQYAKQKRSLIDSIGTKDPHTIPRRLHLLGGKSKAAYVAESGGRWVGRNQRFKLPCLSTYDDATEPSDVFEFCHGFRKWSDFLTTTRPTRMRALVSELRVDQWYIDRANKWLRMQQDAIAAIRDRVGS